MPHHRGLLQNSILCKLPTVQARVRTPWYISKMLMEMMYLPLCRQRYTRPLSFLHLILYTVQNTVFTAEDALPVPKPMNCISEEHMQPQVQLQSLF